MNNDRRKAIAAIHATLDKLKGQIEDARAELDAVKDEEQEAFDNMPESLQDSERGQTAQAAIDALENAVSELETAETALDDAMNAADEATAG